MDGICFGEEFNNSALVVVMGEIMKLANHNFFDQSDGTNVDPRLIILHRLQRADIDGSIWDKSGIKFSMHVASTAALFFILL